MLMLINRLGDDYVVWDRAAERQFRKPGTSDLCAHFEVDDEGVVHAVVEETVHVSTDEDEKA